MPLSCSGSLSGHRCSTPLSPTLSCQLVCFSSWCMRSACHPQNPKHGLGALKSCAIFSFMANSCIFQILSSICSANKWALNQKVASFILFINIRKQWLTWQTSPESKAKLTVQAYTELAETNHNKIDTSEGKYQATGPILPVAGLIECTFTTKRTSTHDSTVRSAMATKHPQL